MLARVCQPTREKCVERSAWVRDAYLHRVVVGGDEKDWAGGVVFGDGSRCEMDVVLAALRSELMDCADS